VTNEEAHRLARDRGAWGPGYRLIRWILVPLLRLYFRVHIAGAENIPKQGAAVIVPNHKSFLDSFFIALATKRHLRFMGKSELFEGIWGRPFVALGAFPVRRGESDQDALETARTILRQGELLALFPEGTRVREPEELGAPKRGAARLALEAGAPMIPAAITGSDHIWLGPIPKTKRVQVAFAPPVSVEHLEPTPEAAKALTDEAVWPQVEGEFRSLLNRPTVIAAGLALLGVGAGAAVRRRRKRR
jgi:1-acyl-sn-glycerol-3-phosphate acyltransferase